VAWIDLIRYDIATFPDRTEVTSHGGGTFVVISSNSISSSKYTRMTGRERENTMNEGHGTKKNNNKRCEDQDNQNAKRRGYHQTKRINSYEGRGLGGGGVVCGYFAFIVTRVDWTPKWIF